MREHKKVAHNKEKKCEICNETFSKIFQLIEHKKIAHNVLKAYPCKICQTKFSRKGTLNQHMSANHLGKKPFQCQICNRNVSTQYNLKVHMQAAHAVKMEFNEFNKDKSFFEQENKENIGPKVVPNKNEVKNGPKWMPKFKQEFGENEKMKMMLHKINPNILKYKQEFGPRLVLQKIDPSMFLKIDSNINNNNNNNETEMEDYEPEVEKLNIRPLIEFYKDVFERGLFLPSTEIAFDVGTIEEEITEYIIED